MKGSLVFTKIKSTVRLEHLLNQFVYIGLCKKLYCIFLLRHTYSALV